MADDAAIFRARAELELANARASTLTNVRERCERAARAWNIMADRSERTHAERREREAASAARMAAP